MRKQYLVCYDISDDKRLRKVAKACKSFGRRLQYSVFECFLSPTMFEKLRTKLYETIKHDDDQVLFVCLGLEKEKTDERFEVLGRVLKKQTDITIV